MSETKKLVILGGGAAGILIAIKLANTKGLDITLIDNKSFYEYTPGLCSVLYEKTEYDFQRHFNKITFDYAPFLSKRNIQFVLGRVKSLKDKKVYLFNDEHEPIIEYDYLVICTGSSYADPWKTLLTTNENEACLNSDARLEYLRQHRQKYLESNDILCIGAGPVGVELAAEIAHRSPQKKVTIVNSSEYVLSSAPAEIGKNAQKILEAKPSIRIISNEMASEVDATKDVYETNKTHTRFTPDLVYHCVGITPNTDFMESVWLNERKQIIVDEYLRIPGVEHVFAVGDVNSFDEPKMFYTAEMQAIHFVRNLRRIIMKHKELIPYHGSLPNMVISLGPHYGVGYLSGIRLTGWPFGQQKGSHLAAVTKYAVERIAMNDYGLRLPFTNTLYFTQEKSYGGRFLG